MLLRRWRWHGVLHLAYRSYLGEEVFRNESAKIPLFQNGTNHTTVILRKAVDLTDTEWLQARIH